MVAKSIQDHFLCQTVAPMRHHLGAYRVGCFVSARQSGAPPEADRLQLPMLRYAPAFEPRSILHDQSPLDGGSGQAGPQPVPSMGDQTGPLGVGLHVPHHVVQVALILEGKALIATLLKLCFERHPLSLSLPA